MEVDKDSSVTGSFRVCGTNDLKSNRNKESFIPLFFSKKYAEEFNNILNDKNYAIRGLRQYHLNFYLNVMVGLKSKQCFAISRKVITDEGQELHIATPYSAKELKDEYLINFN